MKHYHNDFSMQVVVFCNDGWGGCMNMDLIAFGHGARYSDYCEQVILSRACSNSAYIRVTLVRALAYSKNIVLREH